MEQRSQLVFLPQFTRRIKFLPKRKLSLPKAEISKWISSHSSAWTSLIRISVLKIGCNGTMKSYYGHISYVTSHKHPNRYGYIYKSPKLFFFPFFQPTQQGVNSLGRPRLHTVMPFFPISFRPPPVSFYLFRFIWQSYSSLTSAKYALYEQYRRAWHSPDHTQDLFSLLVLNAIWWLVGWLLVPAVVAVFLNNRRIVK